MDCDGLELCAGKIVSAFGKANLKLCAAESCTGGLVASSIVSIPHASNVFLGSAVCYCDAAKINILKVSRETIEKHFAESEQCARQMALGAARLYGADVAVSTTGFLDANTGGKPESLGGCVWIACCKKNSDGIFECDTLRLSLDPRGPRNENRAVAARAALNMILSQI